VGGFVKTCDISNQKGLTADIVPDGVIDELDRAKVDEEWLKQYREEMEVLFTLLAYRYERS